MYLYPKSKPGKVFKTFIKECWQVWREERKKVQTPVTIRLNVKIKPEEKKR